jgi:hypothetical protein
MMTELLAIQNHAARYGQLLLEFLRTHQATLAPLLILTHDFPDPDALAAAYGLQHLAKAVLGIDSRIVDNVVISPAGKPCPVDHDLDFVGDGIMIIPKNQIIPSGTLI